MADPTQQQTPSTPMTEALVDQLERRLASMKSARREFEPEWADICRYIAPRKADVTKYTGKPDDSKIWDSVPTHAAEMLAASLAGMLTNPATIWFSMTLRDQDLNERSETAEWLQECRDRMLAVFNSDSSGFQQAAAEAYLDACTMATATTFVSKAGGDDIDTGAQNAVSDYTPERPSWMGPKKPVRNGDLTTKFPAPQAYSRFIFKTISTWELYVAEGKDGRPSHIYRVCEMTAQQVFDTWPATCSKGVRDRVLSSPEDKIKVVHAVYPRAASERDGRRIRAGKNLPIASVYYEQDGKTLLEEGGFHEMPYAFWRWSVVSGRVYGRGPSHTALPHVRLLNKMVETQALAAEKLADPPLMVPDDAFLGPIRSGPGGLSYYRAGLSDDVAKPLPITADINHLTVLIQDRESKVQAIFLNDKIEFQGDPNQTATEVQARINEKMRLLGPVLGRVQSEYLGPIISRVFHIMFRNGEFPPMPAQLAAAIVAKGPVEDRLKVDYLGPLAIEQRSVTVQAFQRAIGVLTPLIGQSDPFHVLDNFDTDAIARWTPEQLGVPAQLLQTEDKRDALRKQRAQAAQAAQQAQTAEQAANIAKTLGDTQLGDNNALSALAGATVPQGGLSGALGG